MYPRLHLAVFHLSGNSTKQKEFQTTKPEYSNQQLAPPHNDIIIIISLFKLLKMYHIRHASHPGDYGIAGVQSGTLIQFVPL